MELPRLPGAWRRHAQRYGAAVLRLLLGVLAAAALVPACLRLLLAVIADRHRVPEDPLALALGLMLGVILVFVRRPNWFLHTLVHETAHLLACTLLGVRVYRLVASDGQGGEVRHAATGPVRTGIIALAPYVVPLILLPLLVARALVPESPARAVLSCLCALAYPSYLTGLFHNIRLNLGDAQGDLAAVGRLLALSLILCGALLTTAAAVVVLWDDSSAAKRLWGPRPAPAHWRPAPA